MQNENNRNKKNNGWKGIGRSLVVAVVGPESLAEQLHDNQVVVIQLEGTPLELARRRALSPDLVDVVVLDTTGEDREEVLELSRVLRGRYLATALVLPTDRWGKRVFRNHVGVFRHRGRVVLPELWMAVSVAAQTTWTLGWLRLDKRRAITEVAQESKVVSRALPKGEILDAPRAPGAIQAAKRVSRTTPWAPPPQLLVELTKAYSDDS